MTNPEYNNDGVIVFYRGSNGFLTHPCHSTAAQAAASVRNSAPRCLGPSFRGLCSPRARHLHRAPAAHLQQDLHTGDHRRRQWVEIENPMEMSEKSHGNCF